jgi:hypothetical protein
MHKAGGELPRIDALRRSAAGPGPIGPVCTRRPSRHRASPMRTSEKPQGTRVNEGIRKDRGCQEPRPSCLVELP